MPNRWRRLAVLSTAAFLLLLIGGRSAAEFVADLLWYRSLELERVFWTLFGTGAAVRTAVALPVGFAVFLNLWVAARSLGAIRVRRRYGNIEIAEQLPRGYVIGALALLALFSGWWLSAGALDPLASRVALDPPTWGERDPVFGRDLSFYVFQLPVWDRLQTLAGVLVFWTLLLVGAAYLATGAIRATGGTLSTSPSARRHLGALVAAFLLVLAWDVWLDRYLLLLTGSGVGGSLGYTDVHARLPGMLAVCALTLAAAAAVGFGLWHGRIRPPVIGLALLVLGMLAVQLVYPSAVQKLVVEPNEFPRERPFLEHHLALTRRAYGLTDLRRVALPYRPPAQLDVARTLERLASVPLWDDRPLLTAFNQKQSLFPYYDFVSIHPDRYGPPGSAEQVAIAVRELEPSKLPESAQTWQNLHLTYVSGQGAVVSPVARMSGDGAPVYYVSDLDPPRTSAEAPAGLQLADASVNFGERTTGYVLLDPRQGARGVTLDALWKKLVFAWAFQSKNLVLSREVSSQRRIVYRRQVVERARAVAPFLSFGSPDNARPVIHEGRIHWILDGYTASASFPLARGARFLDRTVRYVRNSAKVTVDAVTGEVRVYALRDDEPILSAYAALFPGLVRPLAEMPEEMQRHLLFPAELFQLQAQVLGEYHLADAQAFYAKDDVWGLATENYRNQPAEVRPVHALLPLPGEQAREMLLSVPLVSRGRQNLTALLVTRNDMPHFGEQILYQLPRDEQVPGPQQIEALIDQDPDISQQLSLWRQGGSDVDRGHMIVVPLDSTLLYVEPVFLVAENAAIPQLERVIVAHGRGAAMRPTLEDAVLALLGGDRAAPAAARPDATTTAAAAPQQPADADPRLQRARRLLEQAEAQLRAGDWAAFGRTWQALRDALRDGEPPR